MTMNRFHDRLGNRPSTVKAFVQSVVGQSHLSAPRSEIERYAAKTNIFHRFLGWYRNSCFNVPAISEASAYNIFMYSRNVAPSLDTFAHAINLKKTVASSVVCLLLRGCPAAILGAIISVIVFSVDGVLGAWSQSHVGDEVLKQVPAFTYFDSATTVSFIICHLSICASKFHVIPRLKFWRVGHSMFEVIGIFSRIVASHERDTSVSGQSRTNCYKQFLGSFYCNQEPS